MFSISEFYTRKQIHGELGGSVQSYLPTVKGHVVCACLTKNLNPDAPNIILVGNGPRIQQNAKLLCSQKESTPIFIKIKTNKWQYVGKYKVDSFSKSPEEIAVHSQKSYRKTITQIIYLSKEGL